MRSLLLPAFGSASRTVVTSHKDIQHGMIRPDTELEARERYQQAAMDRRFGASYILYL